MLPYPGDALQALGSNRRLNSVNSASIDGGCDFRYSVLRKTERVNAMELRENLRRLRKEANLTQEALAEKLHVSGQAVSKWERGESYPEITLLPELAEVFHVTIDALLRRQTLTEKEIAEIVDRTWRDPATERPLTPEESWAALPEVEEEMVRHPEVSEFPYTLAQHYTIAADIRWQKGEREAALPLYRRILELLDAVRYDADADDPPYSTLENMRVMALYRLGDGKDRYWLERTLFRLPAAYFLHTMGMGKDFYYLSQQMLYQNLLTTTGVLRVMALCDPAEGEARLYEELPGEEAWALTPAEKLKTLETCVELLELFSGGKPRGVLLMQLAQARTQIIRMAAENGLRERVLKEVAALRALCSPALLAEDRAIVDVQRKILHWRMGRPAPDGTPGPETASGIVTQADAAAALTEEERRLYDLPVSSLPALKYRYVGTAETGHLPLGLTALSQLAELLESEALDSVRDDPDFRDSAAYFRRAAEEVKAYVPIL